MFIHVSSTSKLEFRGLINNPLIYCVYLSETLITSSFSLMLTGTRPEKRTIEKEFGKFGEILEVWVAENPPCFAFVVFKEKEDAEDALDEMNGA